MTYAELEREICNLIAKADATKIDDAKHVVYILSVMAVMLEDGTVAQLAELLNTQQETRTP